MCPIETYRLRSVKSAPSGLPRRFEFAKRHAFPIGFAHFFACMIGNKFLELFPIRGYMTRIKALGYLRVSGKAQIEGDGFTRQREAISRFAAANGYVVVDWFEDGGVSGATELDDRPGLMATLERIAGNGVRHVIV